jgi:PPM family protein phosphatase
MNGHSKIQPPPACSWQTVTAMHIGNRSRQEDAVGVWRNDHGTTLFAVVADGAGGHGGGAEASTAAIAEAERQWKDRSKDEDATEFLRTWMSSAHETVNQEARKRDADARTVAVALLAQGNRADWAHAGDCRLYLIRNGEIQVRTRDDSVVQVLFEQGSISEAEMGRHEDQNRLLQALGGDDPPKPRLGGSAIEPGDVLLLCSDGFWENLEASEIIALVAHPPSRWGKQLEKAVQFAVDRGGQKADNTSVILARFGGIQTGGRMTRLGYFAVSLLLIATLVGLALNSPLKGYLAPLGQALRERWKEAVSQLEIRSIKDSREGSPSNAPGKSGVTEPAPVQDQELRMPIPKAADLPLSEPQAVGPPDRAETQALNPSKTLPASPAKP